MLKKGCFLLALCLVLLSFTGCEGNDYRTAMSLYENQEYDAAISAFEALGDYKDSAEMIAACHVELGKQYNIAEDYQQAVAHFVKAPENEVAVSSIHNILFNLITDDFQAHITAATEALGEYLSDETMRLASFVGSGGGEFSFDSDSESYQQLIEQAELVQADYTNIQSVFPEEILQLCDDEVNAAYECVRQVAECAEIFFLPANVQNYILSKVLPSTGATPNKTPEEFARLVTDLENSANALH